MRILFIAQAYYPREGGGVTYAYDLTTHFRSKGHHVDIVTVNDSRELNIEQQEGGTIFRLPKHMQFSNGFLSAAFPGWLRRNMRSYDLLHFNAPNPIGELSYDLASLTGGHPHVITFVHAAAVPEKPLSYLYNNLVLRNHLRRVDQIIVSNQNFVNTSALLQQYQHKVNVIPFGIDLSKYKPSTNPPNMNDPLNLLFVGRLVRYKGLSYLISAMQRVQGNLTIIGRGELEESLRAQIHELKLEQRIRFAGYVSDQELRQAYQQADVFILPSIDRGEVYGYVLIEAMACQTAAISTELGTGTSFVNAHNETGFVVPPRDVNALADAINTLDLDRYQLQAFQAAARKRAVELFDIRYMIHQTEQLIEQMGLVV